MRSTVVAETKRTHFAPGSERTRQKKTVPFYILRSLIAHTHKNEIINPRRACAARVTVLGLCVCLCVCLLLNISLFTCLFVPQTILTFSAADEG